MIKKNEYLTGFTIKKPDKKNQNFKTVAETLAEIIILQINSKT